MKIKLAIAIVILLACGTVMGQVPCTTNHLKPGQYCRWDGYTSVLIDKHTIASPILNATILVPANTIFIYKLYEDSDQAVIGEPTMPGWKCTAIQSEEVSKKHLVMYSYSCSEVEEK